MTIWDRLFSLLGEFAEPAPAPEGMAFFSLGACPDCMVAPIEAMQIDEDSGLFVPVWQCPMCGLSGGLELFNPQDLGGCQYCGSPAVCECGKCRYPVCIDCLTDREKLLCEECSHGRIKYYH